jgi:hypothetical protein
MQADFHQRKHVVPASLTFGLPANGRRLTNNETFPQTSLEFGALEIAPPDVPGGMPGHSSYNQGVANRARGRAPVSRLVRFDTIESKQDVDQFVVVHLKGRDDILEFPVVDDQVSNDEDFRLIGEGDLLRFTRR